MRTVNKILFVFAISLLLLASFAYAETQPTGGADIKIEYTENTQIGNLIGPNVNVEVSNAYVQKPNSAETVNIDITKEGGYLKTPNGNFENIQPSREGQRANIELDSKGNVKSCDFHTDAKGGTYNLGGYKIVAPPNSRVTFFDGVAKISVPEGTVLKEENLNTINTLGSANNNQVMFGSKNFEELTLPNGNTLQKGYVIVDNKGMYLYGYGVEIDNLKINEGGENFRQRVFFDGNAHPDAGEDYISLNANEKRMYLLSNKQDSIISFKEGNPFVRVDATEGQSFSIRGAGEHNLAMEITNPEGKIPEINMEEFSKTGKGICKIENGGFYISNNRKILNYQESLFTSGIISGKENGLEMVPANVNFADQNLIGKDKSIIFNNDNSYSLVSRSNPKFDEYTSLSYQQATPDEIKIGLMEDIKKIAPNIKVEGWELSNVKQLRGIKESLNQMSPSLREATEQIKILSDEQTRGVAGWAQQEEGILLSRDTAKYDYADDQLVTTHEMAHNLHDKIEKQEFHVPEQKLASLNT